MATPSFDDLINRRPTVQQVLAANKATGAIPKYLAAPAKTTSGSGQAPKATADTLARQATAATKAKTGGGAKTGTPAKVGTAADGYVNALLDSYKSNPNMFNDLANTPMPETAPADTTPAAPAYNIETDPYYLQALASGQAEFNYARANALADLQNQQVNANDNLTSLNKNAAESRRRLAGNYASRGMAGGAAGALTLAEAQANAQQVAAQTSIKDQIAALNQNYLANYGATGTDWTGTLLGQRYKTAAVQQALQARLSGMGL